MGFKTQVVLIHIKSYDPKALIFESRVVCQAFFIGRISWNLIGFVGINFKSYNESLFFLVFVVSSDGVLFENWVNVWQLVLPWHLIDTKEFLV